jgi:hypothetical protein
MFALYHETNVEGEDAVDTNTHIVVPNRRRQSGTHSTITTTTYFYALHIEVMVAYNTMSVLHVHSSDLAILSSRCLCCSLLSVQVYTLVCFLIRTVLMTLELSKHTLQSAYRHVAPVP